MASKYARNISLTSELDGFVSEQLASGDYANASEVVRAGLRALRDGEARLVHPGWPLRGGECGEIVRTRDWSRSSLGPVAGWPAELRATVSNVVNSPVPKVLMWGPDHIMIYNDAYIEIAGANHPRALGGTVPAVWPEIWDWNRKVLEAGFRGETLAYRDQPMQLRRDGVLGDVVFDLFYTPVYDAGGSVGGVLCTVVEHTERVMAQRALTAREAELRAVTDALPVLVSFIDRDYIFRFANRHYVQWFGLEPHEIVGRHARDVIGDVNFASRLPIMERALAGEPTDCDGVIVDGDGTEHRVNIQYSPRRDAAGMVIGFQVLVFDLEDRAQREAALDASNRRFRAAMDAIHGVLWTNSADGQMLGEQPGWAALTGQTFEEYQGYGWASAVHPDDAEATVEAWNRAVAAKSMFVFEHRVRHRDGAWRTFAIRGLPILDDDGEIREWVGVHTDITHRRAAEQALRDHATELERQIRHRERAEAQLRELNETLEARVIQEISDRRQAEMKLAHAQKMETVGKLTGGVAHDFNNLLQVVSGNLQLLAKDIAGNGRAEQRVANAMAGVSRGSKLASQLLAFGRRQALEPKVVDVSRFVRGMDDMLRRAIGEGIEVETIVAGGLWNTFIDPAQVENALLNLAINARDAMEGQGRLTIELGNASLDEDYAMTHDEVVPGQYVMLAVSDTGSGMSRDVLDKVFEPFFSTKGEGKGSGLGLSMVYGFVKQSGGHVKIYSEVGEGTTIKLYLPRAMAAEDVEVVVDHGPITGGTETVLVVEDDDEVRATVVEMLTDLGYRVLKAVDASSALAVVESGVPIDMLFTDVVMPGELKSPELARRTRQRLPGCAVLFTSGYTENSIVHGGKLDAGVELLSKPYTREALARKFRQVLRRQKEVEGGGVLSSAEPSARSTVLLVEDDPMVRSVAADSLQDAGYIVVEAGSAEEALTALQTAPVDVLVTDLNLPGMSGAALAEQAREGRGNVGIVFATGDPTASDLARDDAQILAKPFTMEALRAAVRKAGAGPAMAGAKDEVKAEG
ncbi:PAS domain S-box-containing protein [Sphingomonas jinjuensis]|uniref:histidine kinase n=1 Tax=Sphingomonas jinjuensis TaxID=535907 RepID=A0A840FE29_9SPHN|nr:type II toxin-antitoxin system ParD family antitoxin [Sphingomonas jinjuensis]MBB4153847.1 PAS domain S-box-containing protein [Sphingomonas jinjuensis]